MQKVKYFYHSIQAPTNREKEFRRKYHTQNVTRKPGKKKEQLTEY